MSTLITGDPVSDNMGVSLQSPQIIFSNHKPVGGRFYHRKLKVVSDLDYCSLLKVYNGVTVEATEQLVILSPTMVGVRLSGRETLT